MSRQLVLKSLRLVTGGEPEKQKGKTEVKLKVSKKNQTGFKNKEKKKPST